MFKKLTALVVICAMSLLGYGWDDNDHTMYWQVTGTGNTVNGGPNDVYTFLGIDHADDELGVRIAAYDKEGNLVKYLNPAYPNNPDFPSGIDWEYNDQPIGTRDDFWMTRGSQAYYGPEDYMEHLFQMQLGTYDGDYNFLPLLYTNGETVDNKYWYDWGTLAPNNGDWIPTEFFTINPVIPAPQVPEPSELMLCIIGFGVLMLKRKPCHG